MKRATANWILQNARAAYDEGRLLPLVWLDAQTLECCFLGASLDTVPPRPSVPWVAKKLGITEHEAKTIEDVFDEGAYTNYYDWDLEERFSETMHTVEQLIDDDEKE